MAKVGLDFLGNLTSKLTDNTIIDAGHYSYLAGPTELDSHLWEMGAQLYSNSKKQQNSGLMLLVDDMSGVHSNAQRRDFDIRKLPDSYLSTLKKYGISPSEVTILSQDYVRSEGKRMTRGLEPKVPQCELIVATSSQWRVGQGYQNAILLYDELKTDGGITMVSGVERAVETFGTSLNSHCFIFSDKENYNYFLVEGKSK